MKILIVGAGPTGLTAALECARRGIIPEIVDAKESPSTLSRAVGILPESIDKLRASGAGEGIEKEGVLFEKLQIHYGGNIAVDLRVHDILGPHNALVSLPQDRTEAIMIDAFERLGGTVQYNQAVTEITTTKDKATVTFKHGETREYDWVIGADGVKSTIREKLGIAFIGYELPETWSIADVDLKEAYTPDTFTGWILNNREKDIMVMAPIGPKRVRLVSSTPDCMKVLPITLEVANIRRVGAFTISIRHAETYVKGRVVLAGDAAHAFSPVGGRGMNLGIDDAVRAVDAILNNTIQAYNTDRRAMGEKTIRTTERARKMLTSKNIFIITLLKCLFMLIRHSRTFKKIFVRNLVRL